mmetsp:Transcript_88699/g.153474  ORF Transcript_88699/g.153474 Transcript_88699/m.153474 type:complete len:207 (+) Transcript_88699:75-695(+)
MLAEGEERHTESASTPSSWTDNDSPYYEGNRVRMPREGTRLARETDRESDADGRRMGHRVLQLGVIDLERDALLRELPASIMANMDNSPNQSRRSFPRRPNRDGRNNWPSGPQRQIIRFRRLTSYARFGNNTSNRSESQSFEDVGSSLNHVELQSFGDHGQSQPLGDNVQPESLGDHGPLSSRKSLFCDGWSYILFFLKRCLACCK